MFGVDVGELYRQSNSDISISRNYKDSKDSSVNGTIIILNDKDVVNELLEIVKERFGKSS